MNPWSRGRAHESQRREHLFLRNASVKQRGPRMPYPWLSLARLAAVAVLAPVCCAVASAYLGALLFPGGPYLFYRLPPGGRAIAVAGFVLLGSLWTFGMNLVYPLRLLRAERIRHRERVEALRAVWIGVSRSGAQTLLRSAHSDEQTLLRTPAAQAGSAGELLVRPTESAPE